MPGKTAIDVHIHEEGPIVEPPNYVIGCGAAELPADEEAVVAWREEKQPFQGASPFLALIRREACRFYRGYGPSCSSSWSVRF